MSGKPVFPRKADSDRRAANTRVNPVNKKRVLLQAQIRYGKTRDNTLIASKDLQIRAEIIIPVNYR